MYLGGIARKMKHSVEVFVINDESSFDELVNYRPEIVCFTTTTPYYSFTKEMAKRIRVELAGSFILVGGWHPTFNPDILENETCFDAICLGEGEIPFKNFLESYPDLDKVKNIPNLHVRVDGKIYRNPMGNLMPELDEIPFPDRSIYYDKYEILRNQLTKTFLVGRGCPFPCAYCFNDGMRKTYSKKGKYVRFRSPRNIVEEIKLVNSEYPISYVQFVDDTFNSNRKWLLEFLNYYKISLKLPFLINCRIERLDEEIVEIMKEAGVDRICFSIEHGNEQFRCGVLKRNMTNADIMEGSRLLKKYDIRFITSSMVGLPGETLEMAFETLKINQKIKPFSACMYVFQPYPGTELYRIAKEQGYIDTDIKAEDITGHYVWGTGNMKSRSVMKVKDINQMLNLQSFFSFLVKHPNFTSLVRPLLTLPHSKYFQFFQVWYNFKMKFKYSAGLRERTNYILQLTAYFLPAFFQQLLEKLFRFQRM